ncbi:MAG: GNAT family N-acetyltransferase [Legionellales bacterium]|nr:GNAT family N-acetyltransferase [Legionellales bacterium]|tara:strand:- start:1199 stop:1645 length:447 start_codon:yes stop_codon:yes gene_type:complete
MQIRLATDKDLPSIIAMIQDDVLGKDRESNEAVALYERAFQAIEQSSNSFLYVAEINNDVVAVAQLDVLPCLSHRGTTRGQIENVRVSKAIRGQGLGSEFIKALEKEAIHRGCQVLQLTSNLQRDQAIAFYLRLGFENTHAGLKKWLK